MMRTKLFRFTPLRWANFFFFILALCLAGCSRQRPVDFSAPLSQWLRQQSYSSWELSYQGGKPAPRKPDGLTLGNRNIFAGIGCADHDVSQISQIGRAHV
jgi:hypothetical protein